jgi:hypothetical protein
MLKWYEILFRSLFPYRYHLQDEVDYLKGQLASQTRRADIAVEQLLAFKIQAIEAPKPIRIPKPPIDQADLKGLGWESYQRTKAAVQARQKDK